MTTEIDAALAEAFREEPEPEFVTEECGYCGMECIGRWCSPQCREADCDDSQHRGED